MDDDLAALAAAIAPVTSGLAFVMNPRQANAVKLRRGTIWPTDVPIWSTHRRRRRQRRRVRSGRLVFAFDCAPEIRASREATLHFEDTTPLQIASGATISSPVGSPLANRPCLAAPVLRAAWCLRVPGAVAWTAGVVSVGSTMIEKSRRRNAEYAGGFKAESRRRSWHEVDEAYSRRGTNRSRTSFRSSRQRSPRRRPSPIRSVTRMIEELRSNSTSITITSTASF